MERVLDCVVKQKTYFQQELPFSLKHRLEALKSLQAMVQDNEKILLDALYHDLKKSPTEAFMTELSGVVQECKFVQKHLANWMKRERVSGVFPLNLFSRSYRYQEAYGVVLIIAPWNYPVMLSLSPLIGALAAGNCAILKPSELASEVETVLHDLCTRYFHPHYVSLVRGDASIVQLLIAAKPDYIFFTGSAESGKKIMMQAASQLIPVTLELGGKSPVIVDETANIEFAARRIVWAKSLNVGQTCIAPDFLYVQESVKEKLITAMITVYDTMYGADLKQHSSIGRIISKRHCERLVQLLNSQGKVRFGGDYSVSELYMAPTLLDDVDFADPIMQTEIFGPILPVLTFTRIEDVIAQLQQQPKSLALYYFTQDKTRTRQVLSQLSFGGGAVNDCIMQISNWHLPFGGVGQSGMGVYHGRASFDTFSHYKSIYERISLVDYPFIYPPYSSAKMRWIKWMTGW